jgi:hypothetical protein
LPGALPRRPQLSWPVRGDAGRYEAFASSVSGALSGQRRLEREAGEFRARGDAELRENLPEAQGVTMTLRQVGGTVGLAVMGTVVATVPHDRLAGFARRAGTLIALRDSLLSGISAALYIGGGVLAGAVVAWALLRRGSAADAPATRVPVAPRPRKECRCPARAAESGPAPWM